MKVRQILTSAALAVAVVSFSSHASADASETDNVLVSLASQAVKSAVQVTLNELHQQTVQEVLATSYHFEPEFVEPTMLAKVEIKEIKSEG